MSDVNIKIQGGLVWSRNDGNEKYLYGDITVFGEENEVSFLIRLSIDPDSIIITAKRNNRKLAEVNNTNEEGESDFEKWAYNLMIELVFHILDQGQKTKVGCSVPIDIELPESSLRFPPLLVSIRGKTINH